MVGNERSGMVGYRSKIPNHPIGSMGRTVYLPTFTINLSHLSGQIIATSRDRFPPNAGLVREIPGYFKEI